MIPEALDAVNSRIITLLTSNVKSLKLIGVSRETVEETLKKLNIAPKVLARRTNAIWEILLATEREVKQLTGSLLVIGSLRLQTEYMGIPKSRYMGCQGHFCR